MATLPATVDGEYGVDTTLNGYTIESENVTDTPVIEKVPDQKNRTAKEILVETRHDAKLTIRGANKPTASTFDGYTGAGVKWIIDSVEKAGTYNGLRRWNVAMHYTDNCNTVTQITDPAPSDNGGNNGGSSQT